MKLCFAPRALAEVMQKKTWWLTNRPAAPDLFEQDLNATLDSILTTPTIGAEYRSRFAVHVRRVLMPRTRNHIYFTVRDKDIVILSVWGAQRAKGPNL